MSPREFTDELGKVLEWEFGVQVVNEEDALRFGFDMLDPTKVLPEDLVPVQPLGLLKLDRNPINYFAETEQIMASRLSHLKPQQHADVCHITKANLGDSFNLGTSSGEIGRAHV